MYLRSGGIGPSVHPHAQARANMSRTYYNARRSDGPFSGPAAEYTNEILLGNPRRPAGPGAAAEGLGKTAKGPCSGRARGRVKTLKLLSFHFPATGRGAAETAAAVYTVGTSRERTGVNKMRELVNLTAWRPFPAPPRRPFSQTRRQINEVRYICASPHCCT